MLIGLGAGVIGSPFASFAQVRPAPGLHRIGFLAGRSRSTPSNPEVYDAFVQGMRELGYVEGKNLVTEWRFAEGRNERLPELAAELVRSKVEVLVAHTTPTTQALQRQTKTIPIVAVSVNDPVGSGFAASLARPGGNITGLSLIAVDRSQKQFELLKTFVPALSRAAILMNPDNASLEPIAKSIEAVAARARVKTLRIHARTSEDLDRGFETMIRERMQAVIVTSDSLFFAQRRQIAKLALAGNLASVFPIYEAVAAGGLMSYGQDLREFHRRAAVYVDKILKGANPADLPIEQPTVIHLAINRKTAKALGLTIPQDLLVRADEVIE